MFVEVKEVGAESSMAVNLDHVVHIRPQGENFIVYMVTKDKFQVDAATYRKIVNRGKH